jgi:hypothetical protein
VLRIRFWYIVSRSFLVPLCQWPAFAHSDAVTVLKSKVTIFLVLLAGFPHAMPAGFTWMASSLNRMRTTGACEEAWALASKSGAASPKSPVWV